MQLPPLQVTRAVIQRYARLMHRYSDDLGDRPLVVPSSSFFPDTFTGDEASVSTLVERMQHHAGMADIPIDCSVVIPGTTQAQTGSCSSGACGVPMTSSSGLERLVDQGESWLLQVPAPEAKHPVALTTNLARSLAFIFLVETQREGELLEPPVDVTADLIAVSLGFGPLMLQGSYIYAKSCGGPQVASVTKIPIAELCIAVALFAALGDHKLGPALKELGVTQRAGLSDASRLIAANKNVVTAVKKSPDSMSRTEFLLDEGGNFVSGFMNRFKKKRALDHSLDASSAHLDFDELESLLIDMPPSSRAGRASQPPPAPDPEKDELKSLVADALRGARA